MREPCLCGATDCPRCFPGCNEPPDDCDEDVEPDDEWPDDAAADRAAMRWHDMRERQMERAGY